ncbi:hypothetical protein COO72_05440 [Bifidobacterium callitrichos]|nr:hypothetical protein COO72_05440 [Bifidobacterium callitrichos]
MTSTTTQPRNLCLGNSSFNTLNAIEGSVLLEESPNGCYGIRVIDHHHVNRPVSVPKDAWSREVDANLAVPTDLTDVTHLVEHGPIHGVKVLEDTVSYYDEAHDRPVHGLTYYRINARAFDDLTDNDPEF